VSTSGAHVKDSEPCADICYVMAARLYRNKNKVSKNGSDWLLLGNYNIIGAKGKVTDVV